MPFLFIALLTLLSVSMVWFWLSRKKLLAGNLPLVAFTLLACLLLIPLVLYAALSVIGYSFRGVAFENSMFGLIVLLGVACLLYGSRLRSRAAIGLISAGVVELVTLLLIWLVPF